MARRSNIEKTQKQSKAGFLKGAAWIGAGGFIAKLVGALYRIPLTNLIGGHGIGLYQLVYPVYCLLLTVSATGIPSSIAKLTAERIGKNQADKPVLKTAMKLFVAIGFFGTLLMCLFAPFLSKAQGSEEVLGGYFFLAPSVLFVSAISVFRGWFQGRNNMFPTAASEVTEQVVKVALGLLFAWIFRADIAKAVIFLLLAVSLSELVAFLLMLFFFKRVPAQFVSENEGGRVEMKTILKLSIPVTLSSILLPLSSLLDSVLVPRLLGAYTADAVALFGLFSGGAVTIINLPVSVCYGIAAASVPSVASAAARKDCFNEEERQPTPTSFAQNPKRSPLQSPRKRILFSLFITVLVSLPCAVGLYFFAEPAVKIIFRNLKGEELITLVRLVKIFSVSALTLSCVQTLAACLTAQGKPQYSAFSMLIAVLVKTALYVLWLKNPHTGIYGLAYATNICYLVAFLLDLLYNFIVSGKHKRREKSK